MKQKIAEIEKASEKLGNELKELQTKIRKRKWQAAIKRNQLEACSKLTDAEERMLEEGLQKYNKQQRQRYGIGSDLAGYEFR